MNVGPYNRQENHSKTKTPTERSLSIFLAGRLCLPCRQTRTRGSTHADLTEGTSEAIEAACVWLAQAAPTRHLCLLA
jgi:hypothetical protein